MITASRLASEKHIDWIIQAVVKAKEQVGELTLDIYGKGGEEKKLKEQIGRLGCGSYVRLMGQHKRNLLKNRYKYRNRNRLGREKRY